MLTPATLTSRWQPSPTRRSRTSPSGSTSARFLAEYRATPALPESRRSRWIRRPSSLEHLWPQTFRLGGIGVPQMAQRRSLSPWSAEGRSIPAPSFAAGRDDPGGCSVASVPLLEFQPRAVRISSRVRASVQPSPRSLRSRSATADHPTAGEREHPPTAHRGVSPLASHVRGGSSRLITRNWKVHLPAPSIIRQASDTAPEPGATDQDPGARGDSGGARRRCPLALGLAGPAPVFVADLEATDSLAGRRHSRGEPSIEF